MSSSIHTETISYAAGGKTLKSFLAYDAGTEGPRPGIMVLAEWWGLDDYIRRRCRMIAELGYVALGADMYGNGETADNPGRAGELMNGLFANMSQTSEVLAAAVDTLKSQPQVDESRVGAMGYCLGGALSLHAARMGLDLRGVVSFHGSLGKTHEAKLGDLKAKILVCHGAADSFVSDEELAGFHAEMEALGADIEFIDYPGAKHGFSNPEADNRAQAYGIDLAYSAEVDEASWGAMKRFWSEVF